MRHTIKQPLIKIGFILILFIVNKSVIMAHGGENHDAEAKKTSINKNYFSSENKSEKYEVFIKYGELKANEISKLTLYLSDVNSNKPIKEAAIIIVNPSDKTQKFEIASTESGIYEIKTQFLKNIKYSLNLNVKGLLGADLIQIDDIEIGKLLGSQDENSQTTAYRFFTLSNLILLLLALIIGGLIGYIIKSKTLVNQRRLSLFIAIVLGISPLSTYQVNAHGGEDHGETKTHNNGDLINFIVPKETQFLFDVTTQNLIKTNFAPTINLFGNLIPTSSGKAIVQSPQIGIIKNLFITVGQFVTKGKLLAVIEQNIDANTQLNWLSQKNTLEAEFIAAKKEYRRLKSISDIVAKRDFDEAEKRYFTAKENLKLFEETKAYENNSSVKLIRIYSPIDGKIDNFNFSIGATVNAGQEIFTITNLNKLYVEAQVFDKDAEVVKKGNEFIVECTDLHRTQKVKLLTMAQAINPTNQSQKVLFEMDNENGDFKIGEFVNIRVFSESVIKNFNVPNSAITEINGQSAIFIKESAEIFRLSYVSLGENNGQFTTVLKGIEEGDKAVIEGTYQLKMMFLNQ